MWLRCPSRLHGLVEDGRLEVKCRSKHCGASADVIVLHYFDIFTGELIETRKFREPQAALLAQKEETAPCR
jgi:hypothetical protein